MQVNSHISFHCRAKSITLNIRGAIESLQRGPQRVLGSHMWLSELRLRITASNHLSI